MSQVVIGDIIPYTQATATLNQTVFGTNWTANAASDVVVYQTPSGDSPNDVIQVLAYPAGYSVAFIGDQEEVQVTLVTPAGAGDIITIIRDTPADRENLYTNTNFTPSMLNNDFGILTLVDQQAQLVNQLIGPRYNYSAVINQGTLSPIDTILPILGAGQFWVKNTGDTAIVAASINTISAGSVTFGAAGDLAYYATSGTVVEGLPSVNLSGLLTDNAGIPGWVAYTGTGAPVLNNSPKIVGGLLDVNGASIIGIIPIVSAVNAIQVINAITGTSPQISSAGPDSNIGLLLTSKGTSGVSVRGTSAADNAIAGYVREFISSVIPHASAVTITTTSTAQNVTSISLTAGDYDVFGNIFLGDATFETFYVWLSLTSATFPDVSLVNGLNVSTNGLGMNTPSLRVNVSATTTVYLSTVVSFMTTSPKASGGIYARRR